MTQEQIVAERQAGKTLSDIAKDKGVTDQQLTDAMLAGHRQTIDDCKTVELVALYLTRDGYRVLPAYDGAQALVVARRMRPDLIILDLMLPGLDGTDVCKTLKAESQTPIIMLTAWRTDDDKLLGPGARLQRAGRAPGAAGAAARQHGQ